MGILDWLKKLGPTNPGKDRDTTKPRKRRSEAERSRATKVGPAIKAWLIEQCHNDPTITSPVLQQRLKEQFNLEVSQSHLNHLRATLGLQRRKARPETAASGLPPPETGWPSEQSDFPPPETGWPDTPTLQEDQK